MDGWSGYKVMVGKEKEMAKMTAEFESVGGVDALDTTYDPTPRCKLPRHRRNIRGEIHFASCN